MRILEKHVSAGDREIFDLDEFLSRPLYAHLARASEHGPGESAWDRRFDDVFTGEHGLKMVRLFPETVVVRDQSYTPTPFAKRRRPTEPA